MSLLKPHPCRRATVSRIRPTSLISLGTVFVVLLVTTVAVLGEEPVERKRFPRTHHTVTVDGHPFAVWEKRQTNAHGAILLVHGRTWSSVPDFDLQVDGENLSLMDALAGEGFATYAVDLRGYGGTPRDRSGWFSPKRAAADVAAILKWIDDRERFDGKPALLGWSMGSMISALCAQAHSARLSALILYGYPGSLDTVIEERPTPLAPSRKQNTAKAAASDFITPGSISKRAIEAYVRAALAADPVRVDVTAMHEYNEVDPAKINVPTLILQGQFDPFAKTDTHAWFFTRLGHADRAWVVLPGGDHAAHLETTSPRFVQAVVSFLRRPKDGSIGDGLNTVLPTSADRR